MANGHLCWGCSKFCVNGLIMGENPLQRRNDDLLGFIEWIRLKPADFFERTRKSHKLKAPYGN